MDHDRPVRLLRGEGPMASDELVTLSCCVFRRIGLAGRAELVSHRSSVNDTDSPTAVDGHAGPMKVQTPHVGVRREGQ
jgi:hypothetical protein